MRLKDEVIGVVHGHAIIPMPDKMGRHHDSGARTAEKNALKLLNKRFHVMADSDVIAVYSWKQIGQNTKDLQVSPALGEIKHGYIAAGRHFPEAVARRIADTVEQMKNNGELQKVYNKWL